MDPFVNTTLKMWTDPAIYTVSPNIYPYLESMQKDQYLHPDWVIRVFAVDQLIILLISILGITPQRDLPEPSWVESAPMNDMELL